MLKCTNEIKFVVLVSKKLKLNKTYFSGEDAEEKALGKRGLSLLCSLQDLRTKHKL